MGIICVNMYGLYGLYGCMGYMGYMGYMYDRNLANDLVNYIWDITEFVKGHRQGSNA
jgi:hypothetical protein